MIDPDTAASGASAKSAGPPARPFTIGPGVAVAMAVAALMVALWQMYSARQELDGLRQELARRLADADAQAKAGRAAGDQLREATREASVKIGVLESKLAESQSQQIALEALYQDLSRNRDEWAFAEIEQTLLIASQQLQLAGNIKAALIALQAVDARLQAMNRPQHAALRNAIARDIARLKATPLIDVAGMSGRIDTLLAAVDRLPLAAETRSSVDTQAAPAVSVEAGTTARFWHEVWSDLRQLVRVQRIDGKEVPLLTPTQAFFLRENLKLRLLAARMALLTRDQAAFRNDLKAARDWLARYFDARDKAVAGAATALAGLQGAEMSVELPDIAATMGAMRAAMQAQTRGK